jgi:hypothetical protein
VHQFSFDFHNPSLSLHGWQVSLQVITFENTYAPAADRTRVRHRDGSTEVLCEGLVTAAGDAPAAGRAWMKAHRHEDGIDLVAGAEHRHKIRCLKIVISGLPPGNLVGRHWETAAPVPPGGTVYRYPFDSRSALSLHTPLVFLSDPAGGFIYFRSLDPAVRAKRFAFVPQGDTLAAELIFEEIGPRMSSKTVTPAWRIGRCSDPEAVVEEHLSALERDLGLEPWEKRSDVPEWAREIALVVSIHGMHWTGYTFNTYADTLRVLDWICERIEGRRVLAFLPGWEGRYYWQYGKYRPDPGLGGATGFRKLSDGARRLGVALMPMFGANCVNTRTRGYSRWGQPSVLRSASGMEFQGNRPDWDMSRAHDPGWQVWLNPGAPLWRQRLSSEISGLIDRYELPAVFLDTHHIWDNDPRYPLYEGLRSLRDGLKRDREQLLIAGEGWYDALGAITPVSQVGAPAQWDQAFSRYCRTFAHLMWGDPSRGSSGVHEAGYTGSGLVPDARHWWPTVTIVDGTIEAAPQQVEKVIEQAHRYAQTYL